MPNLLIVDDIEGIHEMLDIVFEGTEFTLVHARSADEGIQCFEAGDIDLVISDIQMPGGDGLRMFAQLRMIDPDVVVVITTASDSREFVIQALRLHAFDFVQKPYDEEHLLSTVRKGCQEAQRRRELQHVGGAKVQDELRRLKAELQERDRLLAQASAKDEEIRTLREQLEMREERDMELRRRQVELEAKEGAMKTMETVIQERLEQLSEVETATAATGSGLTQEEEDKLQRLKEELVLREAQIEEQEATLLEREASLMENEESLMEKGQRLIEMETELEQMREDLGGVEGGSDGQMSEEQREAFESMQKAVEEKEAALREMEAKIAERERAIKKSELLVQARETYLAQTEAIMFGEGSSGQSKAEPQPREG
jgi:YesN/AraC family two-component response regulator